MAKGFAAFIMEEHRKVEEEMLRDAYKKFESRHAYRYSDEDIEYEDQEDLFENCCWDD